ncbi:Uncharacterized protein conserved in bacteria [Listeria grayi]|uniref:DUF4176 domain-containing protein n=1 Tax=Listeria grayi FSL F6-1183 TaxID=1265827 RepID=A0A829RAJ7_LISGR|nr:DUF4176 domain-containing protein [Listeria grayi]EUJ30608.1 hypothetical protein LMUR_00555 [Listeria grayi FSL F6-1183]VEI31866.1 Uncharacterized protein conserved in bacteria [Listeria grayi]
MNVLPIGSIVKLYNGDIKLMILNRLPLYNQKGQIGYFDYSACMYPNGKVEEQVYFFNKENIEKVYHEGYRDEEEVAFQQVYKEKLKVITYPKFNIE